MNKEKEREKGMNERETIYVVISDLYDDNYIEGVFKNKEKAEIYCSCHDNCYIEEYNFLDNNKYTIYKTMQIQYNLYPKNNEIRKNKETDIKFSFKKYSQEDDELMIQNREDVWVYNTETSIGEMFSSAYPPSPIDKNIEITIFRKISSEYNSEELKEKYTKELISIEEEIREISKRITEDNTENEDDKEKESNSFAELRKNEQIQKEISKILKEKISIEG